jgi:hypothetical protein
MNYYRYISEFVCLSKRIDASLLACYVCMIRTVKYCGHFPNIRGSVPVPWLYCSWGCDVRTTERVP